MQVNSSICHDRDSQRKVSGESRFQEEESEWPIRPYYKSELAAAYAPHISPNSAVNRLSFWIHHHPKLYEELQEAGYRNRQRIFSPLQVELIFRYLGRP